MADHFEQELVVNLLRRLLENGNFNLDEETAKEVEAALGTVEEERDEELDFINSIGLKEGDLATSNITEAELQSIIGELEIARADHEKWAKIIAIGGKALVVGLKLGLKVIKPI